MEGEEGNFDSGNRIFGKEQNAAMKTKSKVKDVPGPGYYEQNDNTLTGYMLKPPPVRKWKNNCSWCTIP